LLVGSTIYVIPVEIDSEVIPGNKFADAECVHCIYDTDGNHANPCVDVSSELKQVAAIMY